MISFDGKQHVAIGVIGILLLVFLTLPVCLIGFCIGRFIARDNVKVKRHGCRLVSVWP
jgi:hypothetical protein